MIDRRQVAFGIQSLQQHHTSVRIVTEKLHHAVTTPGREAEVLVLLLIHRPGELHHRWTPVGGQSRHYQRREPVPRPSVDGQLPLTHHVMDKLG